MAGISFTQGGGAGSVGLGAGGESVYAQAVAALEGVIAGKPEMDRLVAEMVRICGGALSAGGAGVWVTENSVELVLEHNLAGLGLWNGNAPAKGAVAGVRRCAREGKPLIVPPYFSGEGAEGMGGSGGSGGVDVPGNPTGFELLFLPMRVQGKVGMVLMMAVPAMAAGEGDETGRHRVILNFLSKQIGMVEAALGERQASMVEKDRSRSGKLVKFAEQVHKHLFLAEVAADVANLSRDLLEGDRVTVELYRGGFGGKFKKRVTAVSNVDEPNNRGALMQVQRLIFDYVRERQVPVVMDREAARQLVSDPALQDAAGAYFTACDFDAFVAAPIRKEEGGGQAEVMGVILVEYASSAKCQGNSGMAAEAARLSAGAVENAMDVESVPLMKPFHAARKLWRKPASNKRTVALTLVGLVFVAITILAVMPFDFSIKGDCQIRPSAQLSIVAPLEERIVSIPVRAGTRVYPKTMKDRTGAMPLAVFDSLELESQKTEIMRKLAQLGVEKNDAESRRELTKISALQNQIEQAQSELERIEHKIEQCTVWSPFEGTVLTENVEQKQYSTPRMGEPLMEVASFSDWELVVDVPESEVAAVRNALEQQTRRAAIDGKPDEGLEVEYILYPWPDKSYSIKAKGSGTVLPASQQSASGGENVFRLVVKLDAASLPPNIAMSGVTGRAKIHVGKKPLFTQWTRGLRRLMRMTLFF